MINHPEEKETTVMAECEGLTQALDCLLLVEMLEWLVLSANWSVSGFISSGVEEMCESCAVLPFDT